MLSFLFNSSRQTKRALTLVYDLVAINIAIVLALILRTGEITQFLESGKQLFYVGITTSLLSIATAIKAGLYRAVIRYMTTHAFSTIVALAVLSSMILVLSSFLFEFRAPRSLPFIYFFLFLTMIGGPRLFIRGLIHQLSKEVKEKVIIYGAGSSGYGLAAALSNGHDYQTVAFIDDNKSLWNSVIHGIRVYSPQDLQKIIDQNECKKVLLAFPRAKRSQRKAILRFLEEFKVEVLTTPSIKDLVSGKAKIEEIKDVEIEDILGRDIVAPDPNLISQCILEKVVLVTGAGGSIGSELCRQIIKKAPRKLILLELNEFSLYRIERELKEYCDQNNLKIKVVSILGSTLNQNRIESIFKTFSVETIYHAAAYKHVPMVEHNVVEGVQNNVFGTWYCAEAAINANVERFVLISTDKAVRPTNVMGASKRLAELVLQAISKRQSNTLFCMVRFGNVLGSSGSVIPLFRKQIKEGGPITVTHPDIIRYFMTIPEASQLVIQAGAMGKGGDVFVLDMGEPVKITNLAKKMIHLSGLTELTEKNPEGDIEIRYSGLRPGEKLYEELLIGDNVEGSDHPQIMTAKELHLSWPETHNLLHRLSNACQDYDVEEVIELLLEAPAAFNKEQTHTLDWVHSQSQE